MYPFIDIHTHNFIEGAKLWQLCSLFPEQEVVTSPFSIGIHPWHIAKDWQKQMQQVTAKANEKSCIAIGECGFDTMVETPFSLQRKIFNAHLELAQKMQKPLIVHCVKAYDELFKALDSVKIPIILHDFGKSANLAQQLQQKNIYLSIGKAAFRPSFTNILPQIDKERLFLETDDMQHSIVEIYKQVAGILNCELVYLQQQIHENFKKIFK